MRLLFIDEETEAESGFVTSADLRDLRLNQDTLSPLRPPR